MIANHSCAVRAKSTALSPMAAAATAAADGTALIHPVASRANPPSTPPAPMAKSSTP